MCGSRVPRRFRLGPLMRRIDFAIVIAVLDCSRCFQRFVRVDCRTGGASFVGRFRSQIDDVQVRSRIRTYF